MNLKKLVLVLSMVFILSAFNFHIYQKEVIIAEGETVFIELDPVDPRSMIQGDYMRLDYKMQRGMSVHAPLGRCVISINNDGLADYERYFEGGELLKSERLIRCRNRSGHLEIVPNSFMFQEGQADLYASARYGVFKFDKNGNYLLFALADRERKIFERAK